MEEVVAAMVVEVVMGLVEVATVVMGVVEVVEGLVEGSFLLFSFSVSLFIFLTLPLFLNILHVSLFYPFYLGVGGWEIGIGW